MPKRPRQDNLHAPSHKIQLSTSETELETNLSSLVARVSHPHDRALIESSARSKRRNVARLRVRLDQGQRRVREVVVAYVENVLVIHELRRGVLASRHKQVAVLVVGKFDRVVRV